MGSNKSRGKKKRLGKRNSEAKTAPRWVDLKKFGIGQARRRSVKRRRSRHWRRSDTDE